MKGLLLIAALSPLIININTASALDMQPGEWEMTNLEFYANNLESKIVIDQKNVGGAMKLCYTPKMTNDLKTIKPGYSHTENGCTLSFPESSKTQLVNETVCKTEKNQSSSTVETLKISDTEFLITSTADNTTPGSRMKTRSKVRQSFISATCSEASKGPGAK